MQFLVLFIAMGIGADDVFVIFNAWEQSEIELSSSVEVGLLCFAPLQSRDYVYSRQRLTLSRALNTSDYRGNKDLIFYLPSMSVFFLVFTESLVL